VPLHTARIKCVHVYGCRESYASKTTSALLKTDQDVHPVEFYTRDPVGTEAIVVVIQPPPPTFLLDDVSSFLRLAMLLEDFFKIWSFRSYFAGSILDDSWLLSR
jgi:hypothetical protein